MSEFQGFSESPLAFCLISSLIRQTSPVGGTMTNIGFSLMSSLFKAQWKIGKSLFLKSSSECDKTVSLPLFGSPVHP